MRQQFDMGSLEDTLAADSRKLIDADAANTRLHVLHKQAADRESEETWRRIKEYIDAPVPMPPGHLASFCKTTEPAPEPAPAPHHPAPEAPRNSRCACGSGKKYKFCCRLKEAKRAA
jgi:hypothetical protein